MTPDLRILVCNDYRLDDHGGGGHARLRGLYGALAKAGAEVTLLCFSDADKPEESLLAPNFRQIAIPKTSEHRRLQAAVNACCRPVSVADTISLVCCIDNSPLQTCFRELVRAKDAVLFDHIYLAPLTELTAEAMPIVYSAHNVETDLKKALLRGHPFANDLLDAVTGGESELLERSKAVIAVSAEDAERLRTRTRVPVHVIPNGVDTTSWAQTGDEHREGAIFIGSGHPPNVEAGKFLIRTAAALVPNLHFHIAGHVCGHLASELLPPNVTLHGCIDEQQKRDLLARCAIGLNPVTSGGGSNLKLPEYFAAGLSVVSTAFGARGFAVQQDVHLKVAERPEGFTTAVMELSTDRAGQRHLGSAGREYVKSRLDWTILAQELRSVLSALIGRPA